MENPLQEIQIRTPTTTYRKKSSLIQILLLKIYYMMKVTGKKLVQLAN